LGELVECPHRQSKRLNSAWKLRFLLAKRVCPEVEALKFSPRGILHVSQIGSCWRDAHNIAGRNLVNTTFAITRWGVHQAELALDPHNLLSSAQKVTKDETQHRRLADPWCAFNADFHHAMWTAL